MPCISTWKSCCKDMMPWGPPQCHNVLKPNAKKCFVHERSHPLLDKSRNPNFSDCRYTKRTACSLKLQKVFAYCAWLMLSLLQSIPHKPKKNKEKELSKKSGAPKSDWYSINIKLQNTNWDSIAKSMSPVLFLTEIQLPKHMDRILLLLWAQSNS